MVVASVTAFARALYYCRSERQTSGVIKLYVSSASSGRSWVSRIDVEARNSLYTTFVPGGVLYSVEQFPRCDLLRLSLLLGDSFRPKADETPGTMQMRAESGCGRQAWLKALAKQLAVSTVVENVGCSCVAWCANSCHQPPQLLEATDGDDVNSCGAFLRKNSYHAVTSFS